MINFFIFFKFQELYIKQMFKYLDIKLFYCFWLVQLANFAILF